MHIKFETEILKQTWVTMLKPCRLQTDGWTDRRTDGQGESSIPPSNFIGRGYKNQEILRITGLFLGGIQCRQVNILQKMYPCQDVNMIKVSEVSRVHTVGQFFHQLVHFPLNFQPVCQESCRDYGCALAFHPIMVWWDNHIVGGVRIKYEENIR